MAGKASIQRGFRRFCEGLRGFAKFFVFSFCRRSNEKSKNKKAPQQVELLGREGLGLDGEIISSFLMRHKSSKDMSINGLSVNLKFFMD